MYLKGFTEELILAEAKRSLYEIEENLDRLKHTSLNVGFLRIFQWKIYRVEHLPKGNEQVLLKPEPHLLTDVLDAAYSWGRLFGDRLCLVKNKDRHWEEPLEEFDGFPGKDLENAREDKESMIEVMDNLLTLSMHNQLSILEYAQVVEEMGEGVVIRNLLEQALPIGDWVDKIQNINNKNKRYQIVRDLYDSINYMNRTARRADPDSRFYYLYRWPRLSLGFRENQILN